MRAGGGRGGRGPMAGTPEGGRELVKERGVGDGKEMEVSHLLAELSFGLDTETGAALLL